MKKIVFSALFLFAVINSMAQAVIEPPTPIQETGNNSVWIKIAVAIAAIAIMALIFYFGKHFKNNKKSSEQ